MDFAPSGQRGAQCLLELGVLELIAEHQRLAGTMRAPVVTIWAISPYIARSTSAGTGSGGRAGGAPFRAPSRTRGFRPALARFPLIGPPQRSSPSALSTSASRSSVWIQEMYWRPEATGPPMPRRKGGSILARPLRRGPARPRCAACTRPLPARGRRPPRAPTPHTRRRGSRGRAGASSSSGSSLRGSVVAGGRGAQQHPRRGLAAPAGPPPGCASRNPAVADRASGVPRSNAVRPAPRQGARRRPRPDSAAAGAASASGSQRTASTLPPSGRRPARGRG